MADTTLRAIITGSSAGAVAAFEETATAADVAAAETTSTFDAATSKASGFFGRIGQAGESAGIPLSGALSTMGENLDETGEHASGLSGVLSGLGPGGMVAGAVVAGLGAVAAESINLGNQFQESMTSLAASAGISVGAANKIGSAFLSTAGTTIYSGQQMATAYTAVAGQLGETEGHALSAGQALTVMKAASDLAEGSGESLNSTTQALANTMQAYQLAVGQSGMASDVLFNASRDTGTSVSGMSSQLSKLHSTLGANAPSLQQTAGLLVDMTNNGITGKKATSDLGTALEALVTPTAAQQKAMAALGISTTNAQGQFIGIGPALDQLSDKLAIGTNAQDTAAAATIFGQKSAAQLMNTIMGGSQTFNKYTDQVSKAGSAADAAAKQSQTLPHQLELMKSAAEDFGTELGDKLLPIITHLLDTFTKDWPTIEKVISATFKIVEPIIDGFFEKIKGGVEIIQGFVDLVSDIFHGKWGNVWQDAKKIFDGFVEEIKGELQPLISFFTTIGPAISKPFVTAWNDVISFFTGIPAKIEAALSGAATWLTHIGSDIINGLWNGVTAAWTAIGDFGSWLSSKTLGAISGAITWLSKVGSDIIEGAWNAIKAEWTAVGDFGTWLYGKTFGAISGAASWLLKVGNDIIDGAWNGLKAEWTALGDFGTWLYSKTWGAISGAITWLEQVGEDIIHGVWNGVTAYWNALGDVGNTIWNWFVNAINSPITWLEGVGKAIIDGLWNGLKEAWNDVSGWLGGLAGKIASIKGPIEYDATILVPHGNAIMQGLAAGLQQGFNGQVSPYLSSVAGRIATTPFVVPGIASAAAGGTSNPGLLAAGAGAGVGASAQTQTDITVVLQMDSNQIATGILPALRTNMYQLQRKTVSLQLGGFGSKGTGAVG